MKSACATCGELADGTYCPAHRPVDRRYKDRNARGYDSAWKRLSSRARRLQPFCEDCGATTDLTADHSPQAWERKAAGKPIRLQDIAVVCASCNSKRGAARGEKTRGIDPAGGLGAPPGQGADTITLKYYLKVCEGGVAGGRS